MKTLVVIPARAGSTRLKSKNRYLVNGKPLFLYSAHATQATTFSPRLIVTTDDACIAQTCCENDIETLPRSPYLSLNYAAKQDVIVDTCRYLWYSENYKPDIVISLQANSPTVSADLLDRMFARFLEIKSVNYCKELICVDSDGKQNGSIRFMTYKTVFQKTLSTYLHTYAHDTLDIHTLDDIHLFEESIR